MCKKILIVGNFNWYFYEEALLEGLESLSNEVLKYRLETLDLKSKIFHYLGLVNGNKKLYDFVVENKPDAILFYRTNEVLPTTLSRIKKEFPEIKILFFHNDNPFYGWRNRAKYFLYLRCLKYADITYVYRPTNIEDARRYKAQEIHLLYPHYCTKLHLSNKTDYSEKVADIVFVGHYEKDRGKHIDVLIKANVAVKVYGPGWDDISGALDWPDGIVNPPVYGSMYRKIVSESKMALCFLSKVNNDVYTRRNFELPAMGTIVVSEYTKELEELFIPNSEIILFKNSRDLLIQVKKLLGDINYTKEVSLAGYYKVVNGGHSEYDRAKQINDDIITLIS